MHEDGQGRKARAGLGGKERTMDMETRRYYSRLVLTGRRSGPTMREAERDLARAYSGIFSPIA